MSGIIYKKSQTGDDKLANDIKRTLAEHPERFWQIGDFLRVDKLTGKDYVDEAYVKLYGNPYNEYDKTSKWITIDLNEKEDQERALKGYYQREAQETKDINLNIKYQTEYYPHADGIECMTCTAPNHPRTYHCWYCGQSLVLSKLHWKGRL